MFLLIFTSISNADTCEVSRTKDVLRKNLYLYLTNPSSSPLNLAQVKDLLVFYIGISQGLITADCSALGSNSNTQISNIINTGENASNIIPICSDGTKYGECSTTKPKYCYGGSFINKCKSCGCQSGNSCNSVSNNCDTAGGNITCFSSLDCGNSQFTGNYYCSNSYITRNYVNYTCLNPGTTSSSCVSSNTQVTLTYCNPSLNQTCVNGYSSCQITVDITPPTISITSPLNGANVSGLIYVNATASDNIGVVGIQFKLDGINLGTQDTTAPYFILWNTSTASNGAHTLVALALDAAGNNATSIVVVTISNGVPDTTPPTVSITIPISGSKVNGSITISANASDNVGVVGVQFKLDSLNLGAEDTIAPYSILWNTSSTNGIHTLTATARDAAGNTKTSASVSVNVTNSIKNFICGNSVCEDPYEYYGNCLTDCASSCPDTICGNNEDVNSCFNDCRLIQFGEGLSTTIKSVRLPGDLTFTNITKFREVDANGASTGNEAIAIHKLKTYYEYANASVPFNATVYSNDSWVLRLVTLQYDPNYQKYKAGNQYHYFVINFDYTNLSSKNCVQTDGYFDGQKVRVRSKNFLNDLDNTCPLCGDGVCEAGETKTNCPLDC